VRVDGKEARVGGEPVPRMRAVRRAFSNGLLAARAIAGSEQFVDCRQTGSYPGSHPADDVNWRNIPISLKTLNERYRL
jgi:hypothetical protein